MTFSRWRRSVSAVALLALGAAWSAPLAAQRVTKDPAARGGAPDTAYFAVVRGADTLARETVVRGPGVLRGDLRLRQPSAMAVRYTVFLRPDGTADSLLTTTVDGAVAAHGRIAIRPDSAILTMQAPGLTQPQVDRIAVAPGALPFINLSSGVLDLILRRARLAGGDTVTIPLIAGPQLLPGRVRFIGADSAVLHVGVELRAAVAPDGALRGAVVPAQEVRFVRLASRPRAAGPGPAATTHGAAH